MTAHAKGHATVVTSEVQNGHCGPCLLFSFWCYNIALYYLQYAGIASLACHIELFSPMHGIEGGGGGGCRHICTHPSDSAFYLRQLYDAI